ncbi:uncharacterized protein LOC122541381 [Chiloscyllium plagiosum]|uniref:uncharacterized protein LOC122541381 n=1 Tax=Chiloscyllium plagiosum TaxID=36176 RepID=UPI001CB80B45|nr:uncharacterized protein LOC122541381 [Chiloscyllium plagiosum]
MNDQLVLKVLLVSFSLLIFRAAAGRKEVFGVRGSSILLDPEYTDDLTHHGIVWAFDGGTGSVINIVDYVPGYYKVQPSKQFQFRLDYNPSNGSLLLKNPQPRDQGVYTFAVDGNWKTSVNLRLIEPLSEPVIISKSVNATIELTCQVSSGRPSSILWRTDSDVIESGQHYQLRDNNSTLIISEVSRSDCRIYFCSVENPVSKNTTSYSVDGFGLLQRYYLTKGLSIAVAPAVVTTSIITCRIAFSSNAEKCLPFLKYGLQILVYVFLIALFAYWIAFGETSTIVLVMFVVLCLLLVLTVLLIMASFSRFKDTLKSKTCILTVLGLLATSGEIAVLCLTVSLIAEVTSPGDKGCELAAKLRSNFTIAAYVSIAFLLALILHAILTKWNKRRSRNQPPNLDANNVDGQEKGELIDLGKEKLSSESTVSTEELP